MGILSKCFGGSASSSTKHPSTTIEELCHRFSLAQLRKSTNNFHTSQLIGTAPFGEAYRGCISVNGEPIQIAVKRLRAGGSSTGLSMYKNEILFLCQLHHPNLVSLIGFCNDEKEMMGVYEYLPNGSLKDQLDRSRSDSNKSPVLSWRKRLEISMGTARGLHYLHTGTKRTIFHRDVKTSLILLGENWVPKLTGFGLCLKGPKFSSKAPKPIQLEHITGTYGYMAPEYVGRGMFTEKCDTYSFGVVLLELICGKLIGQISEVIRKDREVESEDEGEHASSSFKNKAREVRNLAENGNAERIIDQNLVGEVAQECWELYMDIAESCLSEEPDERPAMGEVEVELERVLGLQEEADANPEFHAFFLS